MRQIRGEKYQKRGKIEKKNRNKQAEMGKVPLIMHESRFSYHAFSPRVSTLIMNYANCFNERPILARDIKPELKYGPACSPKGSSAEMCDW